MPLQNRVDPFGALWAVDARGTLMGNRGGRFHASDQTLGRRRHVSRRWIACVCAFKNRHRAVWGSGYTELFFLDEVTALAAGHRPCFECRRAEAQAFAAAFPFLPDVPHSADEMDRQLQAERVDGLHKRTHLALARSLPDGAMFVRDGKAYALRNGSSLLWSHTGYGASCPAPEGLTPVLTPASVIDVLRRGYAPRWHDSAALPSTPQQR